MSGSDDLIGALVSDDDRVAKLEARFDVLKAKEQAGRRLVKGLTAEVDGLTAELELHRKVSGHKSKPPGWTRRVKAGKHVGTPTLILSDLHLDEVVNPAEVSGVNAYNREIAEMRLRKTVEAVDKIANHHWSGVTYDGCAVFLAGDIFSGDIHEELSETNEETLFEALVYWQGRLLWVLRELADMFGRVHVWGVVGNHGRTTRKPRAKKRAHTNVDWLLYTQMARELADDSRISVTVPDAFDVDAELHGTRFRLEHGDQFRGGSGAAGMLSPLMLGRYKRLRQGMAQNRPFDWLVLGHWHTYFHGQGLIVNGSLKGADEYAQQAGFNPEPPAQAFWLTTPEHGVTYTAPIFPGDPKREGWG